MKGDIYQLVLDKAFEDQKRLFEEKKKALVFDYEKEKTEETDKYEKALNTLKSERNFLVESRRAQINSEINSELLKFKKNLLNSLVLEGVSLFEKFKEKELEKYFLESAHDLTGNETIVSSNNLLKEIVSDYNKRHKTNLVFSLDSKIKNGFIIVSKTFDIDCTFSSFLEEREKRLEEKLAKVLFGE